MLQAMCCNLLSLYLSPLSLFLCLSLNFLTLLRVFPEKLLENETGKEMGEDGE